MSQLPESTTPTDEPSKITTGIRDAAVKFEKERGRLGQRKKAVDNEFIDALLPCVLQLVKRELRSRRILLHRNGENTVMDIAYGAIKNLIQQMEANDPLSFRDSSNDGRVVKYLYRCVKTAVSELCEIKRSSRAKGTAERLVPTNEALDLGTLAQRAQPLLETDFKQVDFCFPSKRALQEEAEQFAKETAKSGARRSLIRYALDLNYSRGEIDACIRNMIARRLCAQKSRSEIENEGWISSDTIDKHIGPILRALGGMEHFGCDAEHENAADLFLALGPYDAESVSSATTFEQVASQFQAKHGVEVTAERFRQLVDRGLLYRIAERVLLDEQVATIAKALKLPEPFVDDLVTRCITRFMFFPKRKRGQDDGERSP